MLLVGEPHERGQRVARAVLRREPAGDRRVVGGRVRERRGGEATGASRARALRAPRISVDDGAVARRDPRPRPTDSKFFAAARTIAGPPMSIFSITSSKPAPERHGLAERVEVHDHEVERLDPLLRELLHVLRLAAVGEDPRVDLRVQRLHAPARASRASRSRPRPASPAARRRAALAAVPPDDTSSTPSSTRARARAPPARSCRRPPAAPGGPASRRSWLLLDDGPAALHDQAALEQRPHRARAAAGARPRGCAPPASPSRRPRGPRRPPGARSGPWSTSSSTRCTVTPVTFAPQARASRTACAPGKAGSSAGCTFSTRPGNDLRRTPGPASA